MGVSPQVEHLGRTEKDNRVLKTLRAARERIDRDWRWTHHIAAANPEGKSVSWDDERACRWSIWGALRKAAGDNGVNSGAFRRAVVCLELTIGTNITEYNSQESTTHQDVMSAFDRTIRCLERNGVTA